MDLDVAELDQLRHKRLKLFDSKSKPTDQPTTPSSSTTKADIASDERFARELQAQIEAEERGGTSKSTHSFAMDGQGDSAGGPAGNPPTNGAFQPNPALTSDIAAWQDGVPNAFPSPHTYGGSLGYSEPVSPPPLLPSDIMYADPLFTGRRRQALRSDRTESGPLIEAQAVDFSEEAAAVAKFGSETSRIKCNGCSSTKCVDRNQLLALFKQNGPERRPFSFAFLLDCTRCTTSTCLGCGASITERPIYGATDPKSGVHMTWHCDRGRAALMWFLLCGYDNQAKHNKQTAPASRPRKGRQYQSKLQTLGNFVGINSSKTSPGSKGVGYGIDGIDYSDDEFDDQLSAFEGTGMTLAGHVVTPSTKPKKEKTGDLDDELTTGVIMSLAALLSSKSPSSDLDHLLKAMLLRSSVLDRSAELLRNDSLEDATSRAALYGALLEFIRAVAKSGRVIASTLHEERTVNKLGHDISKVSYPGFKTLLKSDQTDKAAPIAYAIRNLTRQSLMMRKNYQANQDVFESEEGQQLMNMCWNIIQCDEDLQNSAPRGSAKGRSKQPATADNDAWQTELATLDVPDADILAVHYSSKEATTCKTIKPGRMRSLVKEVTNLRTSLPPGIFVRYGESRLDVMKVLIVGPKGTPYENGLFEFDIFCPADYPNVPPQMHIKTTGGGRHRFNPNLYQDGKVCLSLLGTWQGQPWQPGQSTILQVLVSIQAMVFCDEPHCNEPGFESQAGSDQSKSYNRNQYPAVIKYAMLEWLDGERKVTPSKESYRQGLYESSAWMNGEVATLGVPPPLQAVPGAMPPMTPPGNSPLVGSENQPTNTYMAAAGLVEEQHALSQKALQQVLMQENVTEQEKQEVMMQYQMVQMQAAKAQHQEQQQFEAILQQQKAHLEQVKAQQQHELMLQHQNAQMQQPGTQHPLNEALLQQQQKAQKLQILQQEMQEYEAHQQLLEQQELQQNALFKAKLELEKHTLTTMPPTSSVSFDQQMPDFTAYDTVAAPGGWPSGPPPPYTGSPALGSYKYGMPPQPPTAPKTLHKPKKSTSKSVWSPSSFAKHSGSVLPTPAGYGSYVPIHPPLQPPPNASWPPFQPQQTHHLSTATPTSGLNPAPQPHHPYILPQDNSKPEYIPTSPMYHPSNPVGSVAIPAPPPPPSSYYRKRRDALAVVDKGGLWTEVVKKHFEAKHDEILDTVCSWISDRGPPQQKILSRMRGAGRKLGSNSGESAAPALTFKKGEDLKAQGKDLKAQLKVALKEFAPSRGMAGEDWY